MSAAWSTALVTGASSGIGEHFARALAERGCDLVIVARREELLRRHADELSSQHGVEVEVLAADLTDRAQLAGVEARVADEERPVDLLVNNAGFGTYGPFHELDVDRETAEIDLNVTALTRLCHAAAPVMVARGRGAILNVASMAGFQPLPYNSTYSATKAFVAAFSEAIHEELAEHGVTVTALCPGFVRTGFQDEADIDRSGIPEQLWMQPRPVVDAALEDLERGRAVSVPGIGYRALGVLSRATPTWATRKVAERVAKRL